VNPGPTMASESSLSLRDILPTNTKHYDKNRAPKFQGKPTRVYFHITVLSLDSINEESMVSAVAFNFINHCILARHETNFLPFEQVRAIRQP
jgi:hypothetical protein